ncbi:NADH-quinone oxidoreductase subunit C [Desulforhopalus vacuolatus]|uniref:NADH-quinone oxidoreductase subunit C n=1 Tax=Desulforhopalus vacuolatus TaxID=40414 RepID=UPI0019625B74|nr:NADH-quinone oxidoreductase subunit C [Desulforhopalus vacuolatus]MBM9518674.1 NADH-quinone oxidoreductase subunit C [Desulforhopalus vacuolatus]
MICEKLKQALKPLFPAEETIPPVIVAEGEEPAEKTPTPQREAVIETDYAKCGYHLDIKATPEQLVEVVSIIDQNDFFIESITGVDWIEEGEIEVVYDFSRYDFDLCRVVVRTRADRNNAELPTITGVYAGANWHERETAEFFGINFIGHPHLVNLLLPEDSDIHPLRKDFKP